MRIKQYFLNSFAVLTGNAFLNYYCMSSNIFSYLPCEASTHLRSLAYRHQHLLSLRYSEIKSYQHYESILQYYFEKDFYFLYLIISPKVHIQELEISLLFHDFILKSLISETTNFNSLQCSANTAIVGPLHNLHLYNIYFLFYIHS